MAGCRNDVARLAHFSQCFSIRTTYSNRICYHLECDVHECRVLLPKTSHSIFKLPSPKKSSSLSSIVFLIFPKKNLNPLHHASPPFFACELTFLSFYEFPLLSFLQNTVCLFNMPPQFFLKYIISFSFPFKICFDPKHY